MWKPSKRLMTWILVSLFIYNLITLVIAYENYQREQSYVSPIVHPYNIRLDGPHFWYPEADWWITEMSKIDNQPRMIVACWQPFEVKISGTDEMVFYEFELERIVDKIKLTKTGEILAKNSSTGIYRYDLLKNFLVPWLLEKGSIYCGNRGTFEDLIIVTFESQPENVVVRWENLDFVLIDARASWYVSPELSPWGPIHLLIVLGALIYVRKRWC